MKKAAYLGTFDPITNGHIDVIKRASRVFGGLLIGAARRNVEKDPLFTIDERIVMLKETVKDMKDVEVESFDGLAVDYMAKKGINVIVRGLRMISDFEYEFQMALTNRKLNDKIETVFLMPNADYSFISSRLIKEAALLGADLGYFVPDFVQVALKKKIGNKK